MTGNRIRIITIGLLICAAVAPLHVLAQSNYAALGGVILDPQQHGTPDAVVELTSVATRAQRRTSSNELGFFQITGLPPGEYELNVKAPGFAGLS